MNTINNIIECFAKENVKLSWEFSNVTGLAALGVVMVCQDSKRELSNAIIVRFVKMEALNS